MAKIPLDERAASKSNSSNYAVHKARFVGTGSVRLDDFGLTRPAECFHSNTALPKELGWRRFGQIDQGPFWDDRFSAKCRSSGRPTFHLGQLFRSTGWLHNGPKHNDLLPAGLTQDWNRPTHSVRELVGFKASALSSSRSFDLF